MNKQKLEIGKTIVVGDLARLLNVSAADLVKELMLSGVLATVNDSISFEQAQEVTKKLSPETELSLQKKSIKKKLTRENIKKEAPRPPVIAVMGHVDHGKTTLLDAIRGADTVEKEAGGITQHIAAYQINYKGRKVTFLDTPGHEAFMSLREHGAHLTDLAIIVVAADDGVKPQTEEAVRFAREAGVKMIVALNKIDKPGVNPNRVLQELNDIGLVPEAWGGDTIVVEVSAKEKTGIDNLLEMVLLLADVEEIKADHEGPAQGIVIESHMEKGRGAVVTLLIEHGKLSVGDHIVADDTFGRVRTLEDHNHKPITTAGPSTPVIVTGLKKLPRFGAIFEVVPDEKTAKRKATENRNKRKSSADKNIAISGDLLSKIQHNQGTKVLPIAIKADVQGSLASIEESVAQIGNDEVRPQIVLSGVGSISEGDVKIASANKALIYGFNVSISVNAKRMASSMGVKVKIFNVIYELIEDLKSQLEDLLPPEVIETEVGRLVVKGVFKISRNDIICGGEVVKGKIKPGDLVKIMRDGEVIGEAEVANVQKEQAQVQEVVEGDVCGIQLKTKEKINVKEGDRLVFFHKEVKKRKI